MVDCCFRLICHNGTCFVEVKSLSIAWKSLVDTYLYFYPSSDLMAKPINIQLSLARNEWTAKNADYFQILYSIPAQFRTKGSCAT